ncbi:PQQ-like beta-propeller repeat protein [Poseidonocella sedimentorum]|uniref:Outer membrane protein assembly factor BamB, contains PQQ-like beta-propeller repeat n=1 Tax=Poseidonocella sedimentorum TaxID=871652 RepID=A0A1I6EKU6_9RHOB|nr:PQQ-like beta-propeller repeat protein [Poseidonocella sedimentorum]SFR18171.1 Outer membrane protein assembly factor BamB, contains PQQ-like beta-propeller repeat [Poseidonocella sedimentorum]
MTARTLTARGTTPRARTTGPAAGAKTRLAGALLIAALVAGCGGGRDVILTGPREPLRAEGDRFTETAPVNRAAPIALGAPALNPSWTHLGGSPAHRIDHPSLAAQPALAWSAPIGQGNTRKLRITAEPVIAAGRIFTLDAGAGVQATSTAGAPLWTRDLTPFGDGAGEASGGGLAYGAETLFVTSGFGMLTALDPATGAPRWTQKLGAASTGAPTVSGELVYVVGSDNRAWAVEAETGRVAWSVGAAPSQAGIAGGPAPAVSGDLAVLPFRDGELVAVFRQGGLQRWQSAVRGARRGYASGRISDLTGDPVISGGRVYAANFSGRLAAMDLTSGERLWTANEGALGPALPAGDSLFVISDQNELLRLGASDGARIWGAQLPFFTSDRERRQAEVFAHFGPRLAGGRLVVASSDGVLRFFDPVSGAPLGTLPVAGGAASAPVIAGGVLYVVSQNGQLHAFR